MPKGDPMDHAHGPEHGPGTAPPPMRPEGGMPDPAMDQMAADMDAEAGHVPPTEGDMGPPPEGDMGPGDMADMPPPTDEPTDDVV